MPDPNQNNTAPPKVDPEYQKRVEQRNTALNNVYSNFGNIVREKAYSPFVAAQPYTFNPNSTTEQNKNYERYYSHPSFEKLGYTPWADNETMYNEKGSKGGDVWRATKAAGKLALTGFVSPLRSYADLFIGNAFAPDEASANSMNYYNTLGSSTRGGVTGFTSNLIANSGYTVGLVGEMVLETFALGALIPETGGASGTLLAGRLGKFGKDFGRVSAAVEGINNTVSALKDYNVAKAAWEGIKTTGKFINPLANTTAALADVAKYEGVANLAKASKTATAFYKDLQLANITLSESKLEGAMAQKDTEDQLVAEYKTNHGGKEPSYEELLNIKQSASDAGVKTLAWNIPTIFLTNKITFEPLMKSFTKPSEYVLRNGINFIEKEGEGLVEATFKNRLKNSLKPKNLLFAPLKYFKQNFSEGIQETAQEIISGTAKDYYKNLYYSSAKQGLDTAQGENQTKGVWDALSKNVTDQFSGQGFEIFASGFLMGGLIGVVGAPIRAAHSGYKEYRQKRSEYTKETLNSLNEIYKDPLKFFAPNIINFANGAEAVSGQSVAGKTGDQKEWLDLENSNLTSNVMTALESNTYDVFLDKLRNIKTMDPKAIKEAYGVDSQEVLSKIDKVISRAEKVKDNYEKWNERYENPFDIKQFEKNSPEYKQAALGYVTWENAKKLAIFNESSFSRNVDRIQGISNDILQTGELKNLNANDISLLYSPGTIQNEIKLLDDEIEVLDNSIVPGDRSVLLQRKTKRKRLSDLFDKLQGYYVGQSFDDLNDSQKKSFGEYRKTNKKQLEKAYNDYITHLAVTQANVVPVTSLDLENSFQKLLDLHSLKQDNTYYTDAINIMSDPKGFIDQQQRLNKSFTDLYNSREAVVKTAIEETHKKIEDNTILTVLHTRGFVLSPENAEKLLKNKEIPTQFYDINAKQIVDDRDIVRYREFKNIIKNYIEVTKVEEKVEKPEDVKTTNETVVNTETVPEIKIALTINLVEKFDAVKTGEQLKALEDEMTELIAKTTLEERIALGINYKDIDARLKAKEIELNNNITIDNLKVNDVLSGAGAYDGENFIVLSKNKNEIVVRTILDKNDKRTIQEEDLKSSIKYKYSEKMSTDKTKATPEENKNIKTNASGTEKLLDNKDLLGEILQEAYKDEKKFEEEFENELGCK